MDDAQLDREIRLGLRNQLLAGGVPPQHVDEITDVAVHAANTARDALLNVLRRCSSQEIWITAIGPAIGVNKTFLDIMEDNVKRFAADGGMRTSEIALTVGGPQ